MFELETPYNRIVVQHSDHSLTLHGVRNIKTFAEASPETWAKKTGWRSVKSYAFGSIEALVAQAEQLDPLEQEGFIVCDHLFNRIKLKSSEYVKLSHLKDGSSYRKLLSIIVNNESAEFLAYFPELQALFNELESKYTDLVKKIEATYEKHKNIESQKDFAMTIKSLPYSGALFSLRSGKATSVKDYMVSIAISKVEQYIEQLAENQSVKEQLIENQ